MLVSKRVVLYWMIMGLVLIFVQVIIGGVTRLTGSGLSITKWEIVTGTIPPTSAEDWIGAFDLYKDTPQYRKLNKGMTLSEFKFIYFWEYLHRLWARVMGLVFIVPFLIFLRRKWIKPRIINRLWMVALLAGMVGLFGWIMVASGLIDRPWVNAYKLAVHLCLALWVFSYLLWTILLARFPGTLRKSGLQRWLLIFMICFVFQIFIGGMMSGMKAALIYPTWPTMHGEYVPDILLKKSSWIVENFVDYDKSAFAPALIQLLHRTIAYILMISGLVIFFQGLKRMQTGLFSLANTMFITLLICQIGIGISILLSSKGSIPLFYGVLHQGVAILLLSCVICLYYNSRYDIIVS